MQEYEHRQDLGLVHSEAVAGLGLLAVLGPTTIIQLCKKQRLAVR